jgi:hypothetical protein
MIQKHLSTYQNTADLVQCTVQNLLANCVVTSSIVVGCVLLSADQQLRVEQLAVVTSADLVDGAGVKVDEDGSRDIFAAASLREDGIELAAVMEGLGIRIRATILLQAVLEEVAAEGVRDQYIGYMSRCQDNVQLPGTISELGSGLADVEVKNLLGNCQPQFTRPDINNPSNTAPGG